jgi:hypothetical protein
MNILEYETLLASIITLVSTLGGLWLRTYLQKKNVNQGLHPNKKAQKKMEAIGKINQEVYNFLSHTRKELNADRSYIFEFSNGSYFSSGLPISKFTCTYETVGEGITSESHNPGEYRVSNFNEYIKILIDGENFILEDIRSCEKTLLKELLIKKGVSSLYNFPIKDIHGRVIGFLGLDFVKTPQKLTSIQIKNCNAAADKLSGYLNADDIC